MILKRLEVNVNKMHKTNAYVITDEFSKETIVIDPGAEPEKIIEMVKILGGKVKYIVLTHCHVDHAAAVPEIKAALDGKVIIHTLEKDSVNNPDVALYSELGLAPRIIDIDARVNDGDIIHIGNIEFKIIHTPGHTRGGICLYCPSEKLLISGDTLFNGSWGRTDLPTSNFVDIIASISNKLMILPEDTIVYPGHGKSTIIKEEAKVYLNLQPKKY